MWVLDNQKICTPKNTIRIPVSVLFSFVGVQSEFFLEFPWYLNFLNHTIVALQPVQGATQSRILRIYIDTMGLFSQ